MDVFEFNMVVRLDVQTASIARQLEAKAADCFRLANLERTPRVRENYMSLAYHFERVAKDIARRSQGIEPQPFVSSFEPSV
jgi:hypothetical protein